MAEAHEPQKDRAAEQSESEFEDAQDTKEESPIESKSHSRNSSTAVADAVDASDAVPTSPLSEANTNHDRPTSGISEMSDMSKDDVIIETASTAQVATAGATTAPSAGPMLPPRQRTQSHTSASSRKLSNATDATETRSVKSRAQSIDHTAAAATAAAAASTKDTSMKPPPRPSRFPNFSASLPSVPWASQAKPATTTTNRSPSPVPPPKDPPPPAARRTPFGWLSRATSGPAKSPPLPPKPSDIRRNTAASVSTLGSNADLMLKAIDEGADQNGGKSSRNSLKERFKLLRLQEEVGASNLEGEEAIAGEEGSAQSPSADEKPLPLPLRSPTLQVPPSPALTIDQTLAPGTVVGFSVAATDSTVPVDWDFWQTVVNEGPQVVSKTSPEELKAAISSGIPHTIRGVIWQILASSKNDDLEVVYNELKLRGTKDEIPRSSSPPSIQQEAKEKDSTVSSRSSIRSEKSTPATSTNVGVNSPSPSLETKDPIQEAKIQAQQATDRAKRAKEDAVALSKLEKMIRRDMGSRTSYFKYAAAAGFQEGLFNVCKAYALFDEGVGYPQGMNFIIMPMLFTMPEEEAFCLLVRLMNKYQLRELFIQDMPGLHLHLYQFERLLEDLEPALYVHLNRRGVTPKLYATQWFLTLFAYRFPLQLVMRVFDLILCEGLEGAILKFGMALMQKNVETLLAMNDMQALTNHLKEKIFDVYIDASPNSKSILESGFFGSSGGSENDIYRADLLVNDSCSIGLTQEMLAKYTSEWEEKTQTEKARETELENLRTDTVTKAAQIKSLEKRAEKSDSEHIQIANDLVKLKVENQDLIDENETLKGQVEELRKVAASEAANVEEKMREGTEKVMQRNIEVQNENRHMEEQMAEMEKELVEMKMKFAELNSEHESLKQRWTDLRKAIE